MLKLWNANPRCIIQNLQQMKHSVATSQINDNVAINDWERQAGKRILKTLMSPYSINVTVGKLIEMARDDSTPIKNYLE